MEERRHEHAERDERKGKNAAEQQQLYHRTLQPDLPKEFRDEHNRQKGQHRESPVGDKLSQQQRPPGNRLTLQVLRLHRGPDGKENPLLKGGHSKSQQEEEHIALRRIVQDTQMRTDRREALAQFFLILSGAQCRTFSSHLVRKGRSDILRSRARDIGNDNIGAIHHEEQARRSTLLDLAGKIPRNIDSRIGAFIRQRLLHLLLRGRVGRHTKAVARIEIPDELAAQRGLLLIIDDERYIFYDIGAVQGTKDKQIAYGRAEQEYEAPRVLQKDLSEFTFNDLPQLHAPHPPFDSSAAAGN